MSRIDRRPESAAKLTRLRHIMQQQQIDTLVIQNTANIAWLTAGANTHINIASEVGPVTLLVTPDHAWAITDKVEAPRMEVEQHLPELGFQMELEPWYARGGRIAAMVKGGHNAHDGFGNGIDFAQELQQLRSILLPEEQERMRDLCSVSAQAMDVAIRGVQPGMTEYEIAGRLDIASRAVGGEAIVNLVATDDRIAQFRHPMPTMRTMERYAMLVLCMRREGLISAITRLVHVGSLPDELRRKALAVAHVDAAMIHGTQVGKTFGDIFALARQTYTEEGFPEAIEEHHQGGSIGYQPREVLAQPNSPVAIQQFQAFAWNPSVRGVKSEDTVLLGSNGVEVITTIANWPTWTVEVDGQPIARPAILEI